MFDFFFYIILIASWIYFVFYSIYLEHLKHFFFKMQLNTWTKEAKIRKFSFKSSELFITK